MGVATRTHNAEALAEATREFTFAKLVRSMAQGLNGEHPLTPEQREAAARLLIVGGEPK